MDTEPRKPRDHEATRGTPATPESSEGHASPLVDPVSARPIEPTQLNPAEGRLEPQGINVHGNCGAIDCAGFAMSTQFQMEEPAGIQLSSAIELPDLENPDVGARVQGPRQGGCNLRNLRIARLTDAQLIELINNSPGGTVRLDAEALWDMGHGPPPPGMHSRPQTGGPSFEFPGETSRWDEGARQAGYVIRILETVVTPTPPLCIWRQVWAEDEQVEAWSVTQGAKLTPTQVQNDVIPIDPDTTQPRRLRTAGELDWPRHPPPRFFPTDPPNIIDVHAWQLRQDSNTGNAVMYWVRRTTAWEIQATYPNDTTFTHPIVLYHKLVWQNWSGSTTPPTARGGLTPGQVMSAWRTRRAEATLEYRLPSTRGERPALR